MPIPLSPLLLLVAVPAPVSQVTVFTDQARVTRTATVTAPGTIEFPPLPDTIDAASVRVEAQGAEVRRVDLERLSPEAFRTAEAKQLLAELEAVDTELDRLSHEADAHRLQRDLLGQLQPTLPVMDQVKPAPRLAPQGWNQALQFQAAQLEAALKKLRDVELAQRAVTKKREALQLRAEKLGNPESRSGWQVRAVLAGGGQATVSVSYLMRNARWTPTWDVQLDPEKSVVTVSLAGLVSQESGEDWDDAQLTLSTAIPALAVKAPKLLTWKIGTTDRFIPTPTPMQEYVRPLPTPPRAPMLRSEEVLVRGWLARVTGQAVPLRTPEAPSEPRYDEPSQRSAQKLRKKEAPPKPAAPPPPPPAPLALAPGRAPAQAERRPFNFADEDVEGELDRAESVTVASTSSLSRSSGPPQPVASFSLSPPSSWRPPVYGADSPVTLAGGYDLTFPSRQRETIPSASGARRVALWSGQWPVVVERRLYPALAKDAFLSAELKNPSQQVLPGGPATLSVGADPAGTAQLKLVSPGETVTLPLGLDRAIKAVRNVAVIDATQGLVSKEDVSTYTVTLELVNPYRAPVALRVFDQWPLPQPNQKDVETKLLESAPLAIQDAAKGHLEWRLTLKANEKQTLRFSYQVKRPKSWQLYQTEVRP
ncbi:MAG: mucoidy inhibitor MuiA family protein [Myxococcaceae bacterium]|nr:mucoidy inhibitor MuiA family protein [Myxococcaceae bacterium]